MDDIIMREIGDEELISLLSMLKRTHPTIWKAIDQISSSGKSRIKELGKQLAEEAGIAESALELCDVHLERAEQAEAEQTRLRELLGRVDDYFEGDIWKSTPIKAAIDKALETPDADRV